MTRSSTAPTRSKTSHSLPVLSTAGITLFAVLCCAGPAMIASGIAAGALGAFGAWISNPWVIATAAALVTLAAAGLWRRHRSTVGDASKRSHVGGLRSEPRGPDPIYGSSEGSCVNSAPCRPDVLQRAVARDLGIDRGTVLRCMLGRCRFGSVRECRRMG